ncbi:MAG TPA: AAA family ATPase, partial [Chromatiales bacterium]|nr:AAA family ATPase [Chromatiales bacterium]HEX22279.1 AAA family ATPase [Chromatiales bacterium]
MYESFYKLRAKPFRLSPDSGFFYPSRGHKRALAYLRYGLSQGEGFVVITGDPGTGKTTLAQILLKEMDQQHLVVAHLTTTQLEADEMLRMVSASFGLRYEGM